MREMLGEMSGYYKPYVNSNDGVYTWINKTFSIITLHHSQSNNVGNKSVIAMVLESCGDGTKVYQQILVKIFVFNTL